MDLIDLALKYNDLEWAKALMEADEQLDASEKGLHADDLTTGFPDESTALEDIFTSYAVNEKDGLRAFNINSEFDRDSSDLVLIERPPYKRGEKIMYRKPSGEELIYIRGTINGYLSGYSAAYSSLNNQMMQYLSSVSAKMPDVKKPPAKKENKAKRSRQKPAS